MVKLLKILFLVMEFHFIIGKEDNKTNPGPKPNSTSDTNSDLKPNSTSKANINAKLKLEPKTTPIPNLSTKPNPEPDPTPRPNVSANPNSETDSNTSKLKADPVVNATSEPEIDSKADTNTLKKYDTTQAASHTELFQLIRKFFVDVQKSADVLRKDLDERVSPKKFVDLDFGDKALYLALTTILNGLTKIHIPLINN